MTWSTHHDSQFDCDVNIDSSGTEKTRFKSKKVRVKLSRYGDLDPIFIGPKGHIPLKGRITRNGSVKTWGGKVCSYGDGTGGPADRRRRRPTAARRPPSAASSCATPRSRRAS